MQPWRTWCLITGFFIRASLLFLLFHATSSVQANNAFDKLYNEKNEAARDVAAELARVLNPSARCRASKNCNQGSCLSFDCASDAFGPRYRCSGLLLASSEDSICPSSCSPEKRLLNFETPHLSFTPDSVRYDTRNNTHNIRVQDRDVLRDTCALKSMRDSLRKSFDTHGLQSWLYASTSSGLFLSYPGHARERNEADIEQCGFVPMTRPWYIAAASGLKDVVFILDQTSLVSADKVLTRSLESAIGALEQKDYVSVIAVDKEVKTLGGFQKLQRATDDVKDRLLLDLRRLQPSGESPAIGTAFSKAFDLLQESVASDQASFCSKIIVLLIGNQPECFEQCVPSRAQSARCTCTDDIVNIVRRGQESFEDDVSIVTFTEGNNNDAQRVARSLVCDFSNPGVWSQVSSSQNPETSLLAYTDIASLTQTREQYTSDVYMDADGLGEMFTIAHPVYDPDSRRAVGDRDTAVSAVKDRWENEKRGCRARDLRGCELQRLRRRYGGMCADVFFRSLNPRTCIRAGNSLYWRSEEAQSWAEARNLCRSVGFEPQPSDLAIIDNAGKNQIVAGFSSLDGSWIGVHAPRGRPLQWGNGSQLVQSSLGFSITSGSFEEEINTLHNEILVDACVSTDQRGVEGNWNVGPCDAKRLAICEIPFDSPNASQRCPAEAIYDPQSTSEYEPFNRVDCDFSDSPSCSVDEDEALNNANPICRDQSLARRSDFDRRCCGGRSDARSETCEGGGLSVGVIVGVVIAAVFLIAAVILVALWARRRLARTKVKNETGEEASGANNQTLPPQQPSTSPGPAEERKTVGAMDFLAMVKDSESNKEADLKILDMI
ncbi:Lectin C-type [Gracilaria domingensis]|nr:Lectin C-type [Gracilaria domingensis]